MSTPAKLLKLTVVENATQANVTGDKNWAAVKKDSAHVIVEATTAPNNNEAEWKQIRWSEGSGSPVPGKPNRRKLSLAVSKKHHVEASLGGVKDHVDVWVLWAVIEIKKNGLRPPGAAPFDPGSRDATDKLGAVTFKSPSSSVIDEEAGIFVDNMGASAKVAPVATLSPKGVHKVVTSGWAFKREVFSHNWIDGHSAPSTNKVWTSDTSKPKYLRLTPDSEDKIYDLDAPDIRWGEKSYETYNNFRQWIEWNGEKCSDYGLWYWQARWKVDRNTGKQITLNDVGVGKNIVLPNKPHYPPPKNP